MRITDNTTLIVAQIRYTSITLNSRQVKILEYRTAWLTGKNVKGFFSTALNLKNIMYFTKKN